MIISIKTTDPLDAGPVNLHSRWDMLDWGRLAQRVFVSTAISGYWKVDETGLMKRTFLIGNTIPDIVFILDMRRMDAGALHCIYQKLQIRRKMHCDISSKKILTMQKEECLTLAKLG